MVSRGTPCAMARASSNEEEKSKCMCGRVRVVLAINMEKRVDS